MNLRKLLLAAIAWLTLISGAFAQSIGGNASISATGVSANVALPGNTQTYPSAIIAPAYGAATEVFYALGTSNSVAAVTTGPALPSGGICVNVGPNSYVAAITGGTAATVRITQLSTCAGFAGGGSGSGGTVITSPYSFTAMSGGQYNQTATSATTLTIPTGAAYVRVCAIGGAFNFVDSTNGTPTTGTAPTVGTPLLSGSCVFEQGSTVLSTFSLINQVASTGVWTAVYFK